MLFGINSLLCWRKSRTKNVTHTHKIMSKKRAIKKSKLPAHMVTVKQSSCLYVGEKPNCRGKVLLSKQSLNHLLSLVSVRTPCKVKGSRGSKTPTSRRTRHCSAAPPYHCRGKRQPSAQAESQRNQALWHYAAASLQGRALGLAHSDVRQRFPPVGRRQRESLEGCQRLVQAVLHPHSFPVSTRGHASHLLEAWGRKIPLVVACCEGQPSIKILWGFLVFIFHIWPRDVHIFWLVGQKSSNICWAEVAADKWSVWWFAF